MRVILVGVVLVLALSSSARAEWASPQLAAVAKKPSTAAAFWKRVAASGTPLVEDVNDRSGSVLVTFVYRASPSIKAVAMMGVPGRLGGHAQLERVPGTDIFAFSTLLDPAARLAYSFLLNDTAGTPDPMKPDAKRFDNLTFDPLNKTPLSTQQSVVRLAKSPPPSPYLVPKASTPTGDVVTFTVKSKLVPGERWIGVYTPPGFSTKASSYPLVVMFDGDTAIWALGLTVQLDELIAAKRIPPAVVLLVGNVDRTRDLQDNPTFADFVALDLVTWVRAKFNATSDPSRTAIAGISLGGLAAAYVASKHPSVFGNVLSQSGSYWWGPDLPEKTSRDFAARPASPIRFWLEAGTLETTGGDPSLLTANRHFRDVLQARGYTFQYSEFVGGHQYLNWPHTIVNGLVAVLTPPKSPPKSPPTSPSGPSRSPSPTITPAIDVSAPKPTLDHAIVRRALLDPSTLVAWLATQPEGLVVEDTINVLVYGLANLEHRREALALAEANVKRFPTSANAHDTHGEMFFLTGDNKAAIAGYQRSLALDPKNDTAKRMIAILRGR